MDKLTFAVLISVICVGSGVSGKTGSSGSFSFGSSGQSGSSGSFSFGSSGQSGSSGSFSFGRSGQSGSSGSFSFSSSGQSGSSGSVSFSSSSSSSGSSSSVSVSSSSSKTVNSSSGQKAISLSPCPTAFQTVSSATAAMNRPPPENINVEFVLQSGHAEVLDISKMAGSIGACARLCTELTTCVSFVLAQNGTCYDGTSCDPVLLPEIVLYYEMSVFH